MEHGELHDLPADPRPRRSLRADPSPLRVWQRAALAPRLEALRTCGGGACQALEFAG